LKETPGLVAFDVLGTAVSSVSYNCVKEGLPTVDVKVRRAMSMAINKQEIVDNVYYGYATVATSYLPPSVPYSTADTVVTAPYDVEGAKALLAEAGYPNGFSITMTISAGSPSAEETATILKAQWAKIGITLNIESLESATLTPLRREQKLEIYMSGWTSDIPDPSQQTRYYCIHEVVKCVHTGFKDEAMAEVAIAAEKEQDKTKRAELYAQVQQMHIDDCPVAPLYYYGYAVAMKDTVTGFGQIPLGNYRFDLLAK